LTLQSRQPLSRIINLSYPRVSVLPEVEEFLVMLYGFGSPILSYRVVVEVESCGLRLTYLFQQIGSVWKDVEYEDSIDIQLLHNP
jgi:hypothetical protein